MSSLLSLLPSGWGADHLDDLHGLWYVALILMAIVGVWLGFKYESKYGHQDEFGDWGEF